MADVIVGEAGLLRARLLSESTAESWLGVLGAKPESVELELFPGESLTARSMVVDQRDGVVAWQGAIDGDDPAWAHLYFEKEIIYGTVNFADRRVAILTDEAGVVRLLEYEYGTGHVMGIQVDPGELTRSRRASDVYSTPAGGVPVDVMIAYTTQLVAARPNEMGTAALRAATFATAVQLTNDVIVNSAGPGKCS